MTCGGARIRKKKKPDPMGSGFFTQKDKGKYNC